MNSTGLIVNEIGPRIRLALPTLTNKEQQIARDCLALGVEIETFSVHQLAERHEVSAAMIVKLAQHLGFSGFRQFKQALVQYSQLPIVDLHTELNPNDDAPTIIDKVFSTAVHALRETMSILSPTELVKASEMIRTAPTIDIYGAGGSGAMAADAHHRFLRIGIRTSVVTDSHLMVMSASLLTPASLTPASVVLGFSHSGKTRAVIEAFRQARLKGAKTILITNTAKSPLADESDVVLTSVAQGSPITGENAAARVAQLCIFDALFVLVAQGRYEESLENLDKTIASVKDLRV